jgi:hypothetical protein
VSQRYSLKRTNLVIINGEHRIFELFNTCTISYVPGRIFFAGIYPSFWGLKGDGVEIAPL